MIRLLLLLVCCLAAGAEEDAIDFEVTEGAKIGSQVGSLQMALAGYKGAKGRLRFTFTSASRYFALNTSSGALSVKSLLNREALCAVVDTCCPQEAERRSGQSQCFITSVVLIQANGMPVNVVTVRVHVKDVNDEPPKFPARTQRVVLAEDSKIGTEVTINPAHDPDSPEFATKLYRLQHCDADVFNLSYSRKPGHRKGFDVHLRLAKKLDREQQARYRCRIIASDGLHTESMDVELTVEDVNDNAPRWTTTDFAVEIPENTEHYKKIFQLKATDKDEQFGLVRYRFANDFPGRASNPFLLNVDTGVVTVERDLDYDVKGGRYYFLPVIAFDNGKPVPLSATGTLTITVTDVNDNSPEIQVQKSSLSIFENTPPSFLTLITVRDKDHGNNGKVMCHLPDNVDGRFSLKAPDANRFTYLFFMSKPIDRETLLNKGYIKTRIVCHDMGEPRRTAAQRILVFIKDINDNAPRFLRRVFNVSFEEGNVPGTEILVATAEDVDFGINAKLEYALVDPEGASFVTVHRQNGAITAAVTFNREKKARYEFDVFVRDSGTPSRNDTAKVIIHITDRNDNPPKFRGDYTFRVREDTPKNTVLGRLNASDPDLGKNGTVEFEDIFPSYNTLFRVRRSGEVVLMGRLDRERVAHYAMTVKARDCGSPPLSATTTLRIEVEDVNDSPPAFKEFLRHVNLSCGDAVPDQIVISLEASDADGLPENRKFKFRLEKNNFYPRGSTSSASVAQHRHRFAINEDTGQVTLAYVPKECKPRTYQLSVTVYDPSKPKFKATQHLMVSIKGQQPVFRPPGGGRRINQGTGRGDRSGRGMEEPPMDEHFDTDLLIIIIICVSILIFVFIVAIILFLRWRQYTEMEMTTQKAAEPMFRYGSQPSSCHLPRKELDTLGRGSGAISVDDIYKHEELGLAEKAPSTVDGSKSNYKTIAANFKEHFNECGGALDEPEDEKTSKALLDQQASYESQHTYQSMASQDRSSGHEYTDFNQELFSYIPDSNLNKNKKKSPHFTISFV